MQRKPAKSDSHPAEAIACAVFSCCCRTLGALRLPHRIPAETPASDPDIEYRKSLQAYRKSDQPFLRDCLEHPVDYVEWHDLLGRMNSLTFNERRYKDLAYKYKLRMQHAALHHPQTILPLAVEHAGKIVDSWIKPREESPEDAARPFSLDKVAGWLAEMGLVTLEAGTIQAKASCFGPALQLRFTGLGLETVRAIAEWATGPLGPPARELHFHLVGEDGKPAMAREILHIQGLFASNETHIALLHMLPSWSDGRRGILMDMILASWIRSMEVHGNSSGFKAECAAGLVHRWQHILRYLSKIPTVQTRAKGSSAGFTHV